MTEKLLTVKEAAEIMQICTHTVYKLCKVDGFPCVKVGKSKGYRVSEIGLKEWIRNGGKHEATTAATQDNTISTS